MIGYCTTCNQVVGEDHRYAEPTHTIRWETYLDYLAGIGTWGNPWCHGNRDTWRVDEPGFFGFIRLVRYGPRGGAYRIKVGPIREHQPYGDVFEACPDCGAVFQMSEQKVWTGRVNL